MIKFVILLVCFSAVSAIWPIHLSINKNFIPQPASVIISPPTVVKVASPTVVVEKPVIVKTVPEIVEETHIEEIKSHELEIIEEVPEKVVVVDTPTTIVKTVAPTIHVRVEKPLITTVPVYRKTLRTSATIPITTIRRTPTVLRSYGGIRSIQSRVYV